MKMILKRTFPSLYNEYLHFQRIRIIKRIEVMKLMSENECAEALAKEYKRRIGHALDWNNLQTYTEKMQWEKVYNRNPMKR